MGGRAARATHRDVKRPSSRRSLALSRVLRFARGGHEARSLRLAVMRSSSLIFSAVGAATGLGLAVVGFQASSAPSSSVPDHSGRDGPAVGRPLPAAPVRVAHRWAACAPAAKLVHGTCVTVVHRTVTVY